MEEAQKLGQLIIENKDAACIDYWPIISCYNKDDQTHTETRALLLITTFEPKIDEVTNWIALNHNASVPMIAGVDVRRINRPYKEWMSNKIQ